MKKHQINSDGETFYKMIFLYSESFKIMKLKETQNYSSLEETTESWQVNATNDSEPDQFATKNYVKITDKIWMEFKDELDMAYQC